MLRKMLLIALLFMLPTLIVSPVRSAFPGSNGMIVFFNDPPGDEHLGEELYTVNPDGTNLTRLTHSENFIHNTQPAWSPNGQLIAYSETDLQSLWRIVIIDQEANEVDAIQAPGNFVSVLYPSWSPDGTKLVYKQNRNIRVHEVGGSQPDRQITFGKRHKSLPVWSPDGTRLAYVRVTNVGIRLEVAHIDLSKPSPLTDVTIITPSGKTDWCPDWHPTANRIVVERHAPSFETSEIVVINLKTGAGRRLTDDRFADELCPAFSPDGEHVVWSRRLIDRDDRPPGYKLVRMRLSSGHRTTLSSFPQETSRETIVLSDPDWQPLNQLP